MMTVSEKQLIGTWLLKSFEIKDLTNGKLHVPYGSHPIGTLLFSEDEYMSVSIMSDNRKDFVIDSLQMASTEEKVSAFETYLSYSGKWQLKDDKIFVNVKVSLLPNWRDKEHYRIFKLTGHNLCFETPVIKQGDTELVIELNWEKVNAATRYN